MRLGLIIGLLIGLGIGLPIGYAGNPKIVGGSGTLGNVSVEDEDGDELCSDPYWESGSKAITCDTEKIVS